MTIRLSCTDLIPRPHSVESSDNFDCVIPDSILKDESALANYLLAVKTISETYKELQDIGIPKEDIANILPLVMSTKIVDKRNLRNLVDMSHQRMCSRAYSEYRKMFHDVSTELSKVSDEWKWIIDNLFVPKCEMCGYCTEKHSCGRKPKRAGD